MHVCRHRAVLLLLLCAVAVHALKESDFRKCNEGSFCRRLRAPPGDAPWYHVDPSSVEGEGSSVVFTLIHKRSTRPLSASITTLKGTVRFQVDEKEYNAPHPATKPDDWNDEEKGEWSMPAIEQPLRKRWQATDALDGDVLRHAVPNTVQRESSAAVVQTSGYTVRIKYDPFVVEVTQEQRVVAVINGRNMLRLEPFYPSGAVEMFKWEWGQNVDIQELWEERFRSHTDSKRYGPSAVGVDVFFPDSKAVYGVPERSVDFALKPTIGDGASEGAEPYRLYNLDVFEYETKHALGLYGSIPMVTSVQSGTATASGCLWLNAAETFADIENTEGGQSVHWMSETGVVDLFVYVGSTPSDVLQQHTLMTGRPSLPPMVSLGYHQCRWNYRDEEDVANVDRGFDEHDIPMDVLWLDIEHTDGKRYFTWDKALFPTPDRMQNSLAEKGRKMVTIVDPHIKVDSGYSVYQDGNDLQLYIKKADGSATAEGHCWPGDSAYLDYMNPAARKYWADQFSKYEGATEHLFTWNDMNEPSVFNGPEISMWRDALHHGGVEHREIHNMYGFYMTQSTFEGHQQAYPRRRPFILSRSFFAGSQRHVAIWTGDNTANWDHLEVAQPMLLSIGMSGLPFAGADVGGFFGNPEPELLVRWYQAAAFTPFFRGHAHIETKRREPWLFGEETTLRIRNAIRRRYDILPYLYTVFQEAHALGLPIMRPLVFEFPGDESIVAEQNTFLLGNALAVTPVAAAGADSVTVTLPTGATWVQFPSLRPASGTATFTTSASLDEGVPVHQRSGTIVPRRTRARRNTRAQKQDPITLSVVPDSAGVARGTMYLDDGETPDYEQGKFQRVNFEYRDGRLSQSKAGGELSLGLRVERIMLAGVSNPTAVTRQGAGETVPLTFNYDQAGSVVEVRKVDAEIDSEWAVSISF